MKQKIVAILPSFNARRTLTSFVTDLPRNIFEEIILVDDCSNDGTVALAKKIKGISVYQTPRNMGYGGNLKLCFTEAMKRGADVIVEIHPDREYGTDGIAPALSAVKRGAKLVLGNRFTHGRPSGMYWTKYVVSRWFSWLDNGVLHTDIPDMHQGFRVYTRSLLERIPWKNFSNDFLFSFQIIVAARRFGFPIVSVPVTARYTGHKRGATWMNSIRYTLGTLRTLFLTKKQIQMHCPVCQNDIYVQQKYTWKNHAVFACEGCDIAFTVPQPKNMRPFYPSILGKLKNRVFPKAPRRQIEWLRRFVSRGNILDVGSGVGRFARSLGTNYHVTNLDPYSEKAEIKKDFLTWNTTKRFDAIVFWESLEHMKDPVRNLRKAFFLLKPGGCLFVEYPRFDSLERRVLGKYWLHLDIPRHLFHFTSMGLARIVTKQGFEVCINTPIFAWEYGTRVGLLVAQKPATMKARI